MSKSGRFVPLLILFLSLPILVQAVTCSDIIFSVDVPTNFGTFTLQQYQAKECLSGAYVNPIYFNGAGLSSRINIVSLASLPAIAPSRKFLFTADAPITVTASITAICSPCSYSNRDIIQVECTALCATGTPTWSYTRYLSGTQLVLPSAAIIDALAVNSDGNLLMSFDAPTTLPNPNPPGGTTTFAFNDIVKLTNTAAVRAGTESTGTYAMFLSRVTMGLSTSTDITGFDLTDTYYYFMFGSPFTLGGNSVRSGYGYGRGSTAPGPGFDATPFYSDPAFPTGSIGTDFMFAASPGEVQNLNNTTMKGIQIAKNGLTNLDISWNADCTGTAAGYNVYEGDIGSWTSYTSAACNASGLSTTITPGGGNKFYVVAPANGTTVEGSYGKNSSGVERPAAATPCAVLKKSTSCP